MAHGPFARVLVAETKGSTPRETGAEMWVWPDRCEGTIGGGQLEFDAITAARAGKTGVERAALGPQKGQCCGGAVVLAFERIDAAWIAASEQPVFARNLCGPPEMPLSVRRAVARARDRGQRPRLWIDGWLVEQIPPPPAPLWIWGAGHVGRAIVDVLAPLARFEITWADTAPERFPAARAGVRQISAANPASLVSNAPDDARHLILTYSHALDLELCHQLLGHGFASAGLIGSATKWARFQSRLRALGHANAQISRIACPIGDPTLGKQPQAIAIGVAAALLKGKSTASHAGAAEQEGRIA
ncbi:xanthine dehydrogenase accessory protein XdhC [Thioclava sp. A2]|nr:xanthine dehydrogenase accessory protein XdhC [Thioclava sp. A2]